MFFQVTEKVRIEENGFVEEKEEHSYDGMQEMDEGGEGEEDHDEVQTGRDEHMHEDDGEHGGEGERSHFLADYLRTSGCY